MRYRRPPRGSAVDAAEEEIRVGFGQEARLPVWVGVMGYSRWIVARMIPSRETHDLLGGHRVCLEQLGRVPRLSVYDNEGAIGRHRGPRVELTEAFQRFHRSVRARPCDRIEEDRAAMQPLPPVLPDPTWRRTLRLGRDHYVRFGTCDYPVHPKAIGSRVEVRVDLDFVVVFRGDEEVARHRRSLARHRAITDPAHVAAREARQRAAASEPPSPFALDVEIRDLCAYDRAVGAL